MINNYSINRILCPNLVYVYWPPYLPKLLRKKGKNKLTLEQKEEWRYRFFSSFYHPSKWKEIYQKG